LVRGKKRDRGTTRPVINLSPIVGALPMPESHEKQFREQADECHRKAQQAANSLEKETWQRLADDWLKLAEQAERQRQRF